MLSAQTLQFLEDLKANNNREWFLANKKRYEAYKAEYHQLISDLLDAMKPHDPSLGMLEVKDCTFRINRDIRFSKDKSPYKTHMGIWLRTGNKGTESAGYYLQIEKGNAFVGGGMYCPMPEQLQKIRKEIEFFYDDLEQIIQDKNFKSVYGNLSRDENSTLKNPPRGYDKEHPAIEFLKLKSFTAIQKFDAKEATKKDFVAQVSQKLLALKPLNDYINRALTAQE
ncbi:DUF2461 domain-containing protein [Flavobacterium sp. CYK-4]|uniref:DUF2461 domain-containing protein n=1 Tax=Flavobacterium lotistagni TaxID=2709660 RepID=UPI0014077D04|nr:DUF2461 domain-containing protein [Flavobacterium lotistagni]NHM06160.1 DUF2461 domain-containing protein [Flavobacterium lotistagni]